MHREQTISQFLDNAKIELLLEGGVENWEGYDESLSPYREAINEYNKSNPSVPNVEILYALEDGGVDNWEWYAEALKGFSEYSDYIENSKSFPNVLSFQEWRNERTQRLQNAQVQAQNQVNAEEEKSILTFSGEAGQAFFDYIVQGYGADNAERIFLDAKKEGFWTGVVSPKSYTEALKMIRKGVDDPMECARAKYLELIIKNESLDAFLKSIQ